MVYSGRVPPHPPPAQAPVALVTDGLWRKSLSAVRSLGKSGWKVTVMGDSWFTTAFWSRYARERVRAATAASDAPAFGRALVSWLTRSPGTRPVILPMEDATLAWVSRNRESVSRFADLLLPSEEALAIAWDKSRTMDVAQRLGLPVPRSWAAETPQQAWEAVQASRGREIVLKPASGSGSAGVLYARPRSFDDVYRHWSRFGKLLVQERIPARGRARGVSALFDRQGRCIAAFAHERLQQYPNTGGPSTDRVSIADPELVAMSLKLLGSLGWQGIAMVEWKLDPNDSERPKLMEINPRFWGSLELAVRAGVDFPTLYARLARGEELEPATEARVGVRCRWMIPGEILRYVTQPRARREAITSYLRGLPGSSEEWDPRDLLGTLATLVCTGVQALRPGNWKYLRRG